MPSPSLSNRLPSKAVTKPRRRERIAVILSNEVACVSAEPSEAHRRAPVVPKRLGITRPEDGAFSVLPDEDIQGQSPVGIERIVDLAKNCASETALSRELLGLCVGCHYLTGVAKYEPHFVNLAFELEYIE